MAIKLEFLREFVVLVRCGSFNAAAEKLLVARPTLSNHIRSLEQEVGFELIKRGEAVGLTKAGTAFLDTAESILNTMGDALEKCRILAEKERHRGSMVRISLRASNFELWDLLAKQCPCPYTFVDYDRSRPLLYAFAREEADIMVTYDLDTLPALRAEAQNFDLSWEPFGTESCVVVMKKTNPLAQGPLMRERLRGAEVVMLDGLEYDYWKSIVVDILGEDLDLKFSLLPVDNILNMRIVDFENKIFVMMKTMTRQFFAERDDCVMCNTVDGRPLLMRRGLIYRPSDNPNVEDVLNMLRQYAND
ncbi:MAG: LysR family transcriptional regulator [Gordonibacter sp.]|nr:LysR family transcriptional regulator [Gordonibacter sp.]